MLSKDYITAPRANKLAQEARMHTATERFNDATTLLSVIESRTVREGRRAFAWQMAMQAKRTRRERIITTITTTIAAAA